jgi:hypothetical protein
MDELKRMNIIQKPECSYAGFIQKKLPQVWEKYLALLQ